MAGSVATTTKFLPVHPFAEDNLGSQIPGDSNSVQDNGQPPPLIHRVVLLQMTMKKQLHTPKQVLESDIPTQDQSTPASRLKS